MLTESIFNRLDAIKVEPINERIAKRRHVIKNGYNSSSKKYIIKSVWRSQLFFDSAGFCVQETNIAIAKIDCKNPNVISPGPDGKPAVFIENSWQQAAARDF